MDHKKVQKILKEILIPDHLILLQINLYTGQEATVRTRHGTNRLVPNREQLAFWDACSKIETLNMI